MNNYYQFMWKRTLENAKFIKKFSTKHKISVHVNDGKRPFKCSLCDSDFKDKAVLDHHIKFVHEGKKPFQCTICDSAFPMKHKTNKNNDLKLIKN